MKKLAKASVFFAALLLAAAMSVLFVACGHEHTAGSEWEKDETNHWHVCTECDEVMDEAAHTPGEWQQDVESGEHYRVCTVCGYETDRAAHTAGDELKFNADFTQQWNECTVCGAKVNEAAHTHTAGTEWKHDDTNHWHECTACGQKVGEAAHVSDEVLHFNDDYTQQWNECKTCGAKMNETAHTHSGGTWTAEGDQHYKTCESCNQKYDVAVHDVTDVKYETTEEQHWQVCKVCGAEVNKGDHVWNSGEEKTPATYEDDGIMLYTCTTCGKTKEEVIPQKQHTYDDAWTYTTTHHWHACIDTDIDPTNPGENISYNVALGDYYYSFLRKDEGYHVFDEGVLSDDGTYKTYTCECGYSKTSQIVTAEASDSVILQSTEDSKTSSDISLYPGIGEIWVIDGIYAFRLSDNTPVGSGWVARSSREQFTDGWKIETQDPDTLGRETAFRVYLPAIDFTKYTSVSFNIVTNNALGFSLTDVAGRVSFPAETVGTITYTYDASKVQLNVTFAVGDVMSSATITDTATILGLSKITFLVWGQNFTAIDIGSIKGTVTARTTEEYPVYLFGGDIPGSTNGRESGIGRTDIVDDKSVYWKNGVYCYNEDADEYKIVETSTTYENGLSIYTQSGVADVYEKCIIYLPLIDFSTYQNISFKINGSSHIRNLIVDDESVSLQNAEATFVCLYNAEESTVSVMVQVNNGTDPIQFTITDSAVVNGTSAFTFEVEGQQYGATHISPIVNTFTLA